MCHPEFIWAAPPASRVLPSRCVRCGVGSRDFLCASCIDYLIAYHPLWLNPALLPGPSLLDLVAPREAPVVSVDLTQVEWEEPRAEPSAAAAVRLIHLLRLPDDAHPTVSVGDAELLHGFLRDARRSTPGEPEVGDALAAMYRYLSTSEWMPPHLAEEYRLRANVLEPVVARAPAGTAIAEWPRLEGIRTSPSQLESESAGDESELLPELPSMDLEPAEEETSLPAVEPVPPEPIPKPEPPLPLPEPSPGPQPEPQPEPEPEETPVDVAKWTEFESMKHALDVDRADMEAWTRSRAEELRAKEASLVERERRLATKEQDVEAEARAATERPVALETDEARRDVLRFLAFEGGDASMALLRYEQAIQRDDRNPDAWTGKGVALQQLERYLEALEAFDRALSLKPDHALAQKWRVTCLRHIESEASG